MSPRVSDLVDAVTDAGGAFVDGAPAGMEVVFMGGARWRVDIRDSTSFHVSRFGLSNAARMRGTLFSPAFMAAVGSPEPDKPHDRALLVVNSFLELLVRVRILGTMCRNGTAYTTERNGQI